MFKKMIKEALIKILGFVLLIVFYPFNGLMTARKNRLKNSYIKNKASITDRDAHVILSDLAWNEYKQGNYAQSKVYAKDLLFLNKNLDKNWNTGNALHHSHTIIGLINLERGNIQSAVNHLIKSSKTTGSPQLKTRGPTFLLARKLYEQGEDEAVIKYLQNCSKFWEHDKGRLFKWVDDINNGRDPDLCQQKT